jgi:hypothetical protein
LAWRWSWAIAPIGPQNAVFVAYIPGNTYTVTDITKTNFALNCNGAAGGGATTTISLIHPNQYAPGTVIGFSVHAYSTVVGAMVLTSTAAGVKFTGAFNSNKLSITNPLNYSLPTPNNIFIKLMSDGIDTWYRIGM